MGTKIENYRNRRAGKPYHKPIPINYFVALKVERERFEAVVRNMGGHIDWSPTTISSRVRAQIVIQGIRIEIDARGVYRAPDGLEYYARIDHWTHVRVSQTDVHMMGKGRDSFDRYALTVNYLYSALSGQG